MRHLASARWYGPLVNQDGVVRLLAEPARLRVFAALVLGARSPAEVVDATGLEVRDVVSGLRRRIISTKSLVAAVISVRASCLHDLISASLRACSAAATSGSGRSNEGPSIEVPSGLTILI